jgi:tetratricopeptide (TPR) repeat protein
MTRTLFLATATEKIMGWIDLFRSTLWRHNPKENNEVVILTYPEAFSDIAKRHLEEKGISIYENRMDVLPIERFNSVSAEDERVYWLKHLGKASLVDAYLAEFTPTGHDYVVISDMDVLFQTSLNAFLRGLQPGRIGVAQEVRPLRDFPFLLRKLRRAREIEDYAGATFDYGRHEINYGFLCGRSQAVSDFIRRFLDFMVDEKVARLLDGQTGDIHGYHEQDFLRLFLQVNGYNRVQVLPPKAIIHLCHRGQGRELEHLRPLIPPQGKGLSVPCVVHFAGGVWPMFPEISAFLDCYHFPESCPSFDEYFRGLAIGIDGAERCYKLDRSTSPGAGSTLREALYLQALCRPKEATRTYSTIHRKDPSRLDICWLLARAQIEEGDFEKGLGLIDDILERVPDWVELRIHGAQILAEKGQKEEALSIFKAVRALAPERGDCLLPTIKLMVELGCREEALEQLKTFKRESKATLDILQEGLCLEALGEFEAAKELYNESLRKWPSWTELRIRVGYVNKGLGNLREALSAFEEILHEDPSRMDLRIEQIGFLTRLGRRNEAEEIFSRMKRTGGETLDTFYEGLCLKMLGQDEEALARFNEVIAKEGASVEAHLQVGHCLRKLGRHEAALRSFQDVISRDRFRGDARVHEIELLKRLGRAKEANDVLLELKGETQSSLNPFQEALCLKILGQYEAALAKFREALANTGESLEVRTEMGHVLRLLGRFEEALINFKAVLEMDSSRVDLKYMVVFLFAKLGRFEEANEFLREMERELGEALMRDPYGYGLHLKMVKRHEDAIEMFERVTAEDPRFCDSQYQKGGALAALGHYEEAMMCFREVLAHSPERTDVKLSVSDVYKYMKRYEEALKTIDEIKEMHPADGDIDLKRNQLVELIKRPSVTEEGLWK